MSECPVCNGMESLARTCPECDDGTLLDDLGPVDSYYGPYSPYEEHADELVPPDEPACTHLCRCPECDTEHIVSVNER